MFSSESICISGILLPKKALNGIVVFFSPCNCVFALFRFKIFVGAVAQQFQEGK